MYLPTFKSGIDSLAFLRATDWKFLCQMTMLAIGDATEFFVPEFALKIVKLMNWTFEIGHLLYDKEPWSVDRLHVLEELVHGYGHLFHDVFGRVSG